MSSDRYIVWESDVDNGTYHVSVLRRTDGTPEERNYEADLVVRRGDEEVYRARVGLSYGAVFGPDVADLDAWQEAALRIIDGDYRKRGQQPPRET
jgi:hypothetical protein